VYLQVKKNEVHGNNFELSKINDRDDKTRFKCRVKYLNFWHLNTRIIKQFHIIGKINCPVSFQYEITSNLILSLVCRINQIENKIQLNYKSTSRRRLQFYLLCLKQVSINLFLLSLPSGTISKSISLTS